jgi:hypothetical protein
MYKLIEDVSRKLFAGEDFNVQERQKIVNELLANISGKDTVERFNKGVKSPEY